MAESETIAEAYDKAVFLELAAVSTPLTVYSITTVIRNRYSGPSHNAPTQYAIGLVANSLTRLVNDGRAIRTLVDDNGLTLEAFQLAPLERLSLEAAE